MLPLEPVSVVPARSASDILDALPMGVAELDVSGRVLFANQALADLLADGRPIPAGSVPADLGWRADRTPLDGAPLDGVPLDGVPLDGATVGDLFDPGRAGDLLAALRQGTSPVRTVPVTFRLLRAERELFVRLALARIEGVGQGFGFVVTVDDVTVETRRIAEAARRLGLAFEASPDGFAIFEAVRDGAGEVIELRLRSINDVGRIMIGGESDTALLGRELRSLDPEADANGMWGRMAGVLATGHPASSRTEYGTGTDRLMIIDVLLARLDENSVVTSFREVTHAVEGERLLTRAYEETAEMRATLQTALDATSDGFAVYALEVNDVGELEAMRVVHANAAGAESLGLDPDAMVGMELHEFFPEVESSGLWERLAVAALTKGPQYHRVLIFDVDGNWESSWDNTVAPVGEERMAITWRNSSAEESALRQLAQTRDEAMYSATHDALTDLPNRVLLRQHLQEALRVCRPDERVGLVFVDLDKFKAINDTYGHAAGDAVLKATASRLKRLVRHGDLAARLAGDEFVLVLTRLAQDWTPEQFFGRASVQLSEPVWIEDVQLHPSASLGVVLADHERSPSDVDALIKEADVAMYRNKATRRGPEDT